MSDDGLVSREEFVRLLGFSSFVPVKRYIELGIKYSLLKKDAIETKLTDKNIKSYYYPKSWVATIKKDWATPVQADGKGGRLPKPRDKGDTKPVISLKTTSKPSIKAVAEDRSINVTIPSKDAYELLLAQLGSKAGIANFLLEKLKEKYEAKLTEIDKIEREFEAKQRLLDIEREEKLKALREGKPVKAILDKEL